MDGIEWMLNEGIIRRRSAKTYSVDEAGLARYLRRVHYVFREGRFYQYDGMGYRPCRKEDLVRFAFDLIWEKGEKIHSDIYRSGMSSMKDSVRYLRSDFEREPFEDGADERYRGHLVAFRNGLYNVDTDTLLPHTPDVFVIRWLDVDYDPSVTDDEISETFWNILPEERDYCIYFTALGRTLFSHTHPTFMTLIYGSFSTGKSFLIHTIDKMCTELGYHCMQSDMLNNCRVAAELKDHIANLCWGVSIHNKDFGLKWTRIQPLILGETVTSNLKHEPLTKYVNETPLWFCTERPYHPDKVPENIRNHMYLVHCKYHQDEGKLRRICENRSEKAKLWTVNEALKYYRRFLAEGCPDVRFDSLELFADHLTKGYGYKSMECYLIDNTFRDVYEDYSRFCEKHLSDDDLPVLSKIAFSKSVRDRYDVHLEKKSVRYKDRTTSEIVFKWKWELEDEGEVQETQED